MNYDEIREELCLTDVEADAMDEPHGTRYPIEEASDLLHKAKEYRDEYGEFGFGNVGHNAMKNLVKELLPFCPRETDELESADAAERVEHTSYARMSQNECMNRPPIRRRLRPTSEEPSPESVGNHSARAALAMRRCIRQHVTITLD